MSDASDPKPATDALRRSLDPDPERMRQLGYKAIDRIVDHLATLPEQRVARRGSGPDFISKVDEPLPEDGQSIEDCMQFFFDRVVPDMTSVNHPRFHAYIPAPSSFAGAIGEILAAGTNPFVGTWLGGATFSALELTVLRWFTEMLSVPKLNAGILTSGGSMANLVGLATAKAKFGDSMIEQGVIYVSREGHASLNKAAKIIGFRNESIRIIDVDAQFRIRVDSLIRQIESDRNKGLTPFFVSANAGTTNTGAIDPLDELASVCKQQNLWFHVDAAYGGFAAIVPNVRTSMKGIEEADSLTLDPHKWLYCPIGVGCALVRDSQSLESAFSTDGHYLKDLPQGEIHFHVRGPELSRPARVLSAWMVLRSSGVAELRYQIEEDIRLAELAAGMLAEDQRIDVLPVGLSIVPFRLRLKENESEEDRAARDTALMEATLADGELMLSSTTLGGISTLRFVVMNHRTTEADVVRSIEKIKALIA